MITFGIGAIVNLYKKHTASKTGYLRVPVYWFQDTQYFALFSKWEGNFIIAIAHKKKIAVNFQFLLSASHCLHSLTH